MEDGKPPMPGLRQLLWIAAGVVVLTVLVTAGSWLFSPRAPENPSTPWTGHLQEEEVRKETFTPEAARPAPEGAPAAPGAAHPLQPPPAAPENQAAPAPESAPSTQAEPAPASPERTENPTGSPVAQKAPGPAGAFGVQVGAFSTREKAEEVQRRLAGGHFRASVVRKGGLFKVVVAGYADRTEAEKGAAALKQAGYGSAFVVPME